MVPTILRFTITWRRQRAKKREPPASAGLNAAEASATRMILPIPSLITPVFGLIAVGFLAARTGYVSAGVGRAANELGYKVAMPALLFRAMLQVGEVPVSPMWLIAAFAVTVGTVWMAATLIARNLLGRPAADLPAYAMAACFSNGVMLGFPIITSVLGPQAATPIAFLATCETLGLWLAGTLQMEIIRRGASGLTLRSATGVLADVARNPLIMAMIAGLMFRYAGLQLPALPGRLIELTAQAGVPVSLLGLGLSLAAYEIRGQTSSIATIMLLKIVACPLLALLVTTKLLALPSLWSAALVLYVAMPVGANAFLFASRYEQAVAPVSAAVAISTLLAVVTVSLVIAVVNMQGLTAL